MTLSFSDAAKAKQLREYFARHGRIYIVVNATLEDVDVPERFRGDPALRLVLNTRMPQPILIFDDRLESNFSFSGVRYPCRIPMHAIWAAYVPDGDLAQGMVWEDSVPEMVLPLIEAARGSVKARHGKAQENAAREPSDDQEKTKGSGRKVGHLRVIK